jgi:hypothetical protein
MEIKRLTMQNSRIFDWAVLVLAFLLFFVALYCFVADPEIGIPMMIPAIALTFIKAHEMNSKEIRKSKVFWFFYWSLILLSALLLFVFFEFFLILHNLLPGTNL